MQAPDHGISAAHKLDDFTQTTVAAYKFTRCSGRDGVK